MLIQTCSLYCATMF